MSCLLVRACLCVSDPHREGESLVAHDLLARPRACACDNDPHSEDESLVTHTLFVCSCVCLCVCVCVCATHPQREGESLVAACMWVS